MAVKAVLFDVDGTLVNSEPVSVQSILDLYSQEYGVTIPPEAIVPFYGASDHAIFGAFNRQFGVEDSVERQIAVRAEIYSRLSSAVCEIPGACAFIRSCKAAGLKIAIATSATPVHLADNLTALGFQRDYFDFVISGDMVEHAKPHPEIYLRAVKGVGCLSEECLVFEDSLNGHRSANSAGCRSLGIEGTFSKDKAIAAGAGAVLESFLDFPAFDSIESFNRSLDSLI